jgi:hypothetical protein
MKNKLKTYSLFLVVILWGTLLGGIIYEHLVFTPVYVSALPDSAVVVNGAYGLDNSVFWRRIHPVLIVSLGLTLAINWKSKTRRKLMMTSIVVYALTLTVTFLYFVPELMEFKNSSNLPGVSSAEWSRRGQLWLTLSWIRGAVMYAGFLPLLVALRKPADVPNSLDAEYFRANYSSN